MVLWYRSDRSKHCRSRIRSTCWKAEASSCWFCAQSSRLTRRSSTSLTPSTARKPVPWTSTSCGWPSQALGSLMRIWSLCGRLRSISTPTRRRWSSYLLSRCSHRTAAVYSVSQWLPVSSRSTACCCSATYSHDIRRRWLGRCFRVCSWLWPTYATWMRNTRTFFWRWIRREYNLWWRKCLTWTSDC